MNFNEILMETSTQSTYLTAVFSLFFFKKLGEEIKILSFWVCFKVILEVLLLVAANNDLSTLALMHFYVPIEFCFLAFMFAKVSKTYISEKIYYYAMAVFLIFSLLNVIFFEPLTTPNTLGRALESILVMSFCFIYFAQLLSQLSVERLDKDPFFWISCALLLFFTANIFKFLVVSFFQEPANFSYFFEILLNFLNVLCNLAFCLAIWLSSRQKK